MRQETRGENKKSTRATRWKTRGDLLLVLGVARVHLIYWTLRNAEGTTPKLSHYPSEALTGDKDPNTHQTHAGYIGSTDNK